MFVKITDGHNHFRVSEGAFHTYYQWNGFVIESEEEKQDDFTAYAEEEKQGVENFYATTPLSDMTPQQLREYAEMLGVDLSDVKSTKQARARIAKRLDEA